MVEEGLIERERRGAARRPRAARPAAAPVPRSRRRQSRSSPRGCRPRPARPAARSSSTADEAEAAAKIGRKVILVRVETSPEDIHGMHAAQGILTARGGMTSHAAVVARGMGKCCVAGCGDIKVDYSRAAVHRPKRRGRQEGRRHHPRRLHRRGHAGRRCRPCQPELTGDFGHADGLGRRHSARMKVRTNADTPHDAKVAREFGAEGIGLCRTEHMFFEAERIAAVREMILSEDLEGRKTGPGQDPADAEGRFRRHLPGDEGAAGHHPPARPAAARVPAARPRRRSRSWPRTMEVPAATLKAQGRVAARVQPDARPSRLPPGDHLPGDLRHAGAGDHGSGLRTGQERGLRASSRRS